MNPIVAEWVRKAHDDWVMTRSAARMRPPRLNAVCTNAQQTIEKLMKAVLIDRGVEPPYTHYLDQLSQLITGVIPTWNRPQGQLRSLSTLGVSVRYPGLDADLEAAREVMQTSQELREALLALLPADAVRPSFQTDLPFGTSLASEDLPMTTVTSTPSKSAPAKPVGARIFNFGAGPSVLPEEVIRQIQEDVWNYKGCGMGVLEISHRAKHYDAIVAEVDKDIRELGNIPANYKVLFMTGGATGQNWIVPANLLPKGGVADYIVTGYWGEASLKDAQQYLQGRDPFAKINLAGSSKDKNYNYIPADADLKYSEKPAFVHMTTNNTIYGTQWHRVPRAPAGVPIIADASSDIFSGPIDITKYGALYGGAQKNLGTTGATFVIIRDDLIANANKDIPRMTQYATYAKDESRPNTPPHFAIYTVGLMAKWIKSQGGLAALQKKNEEKAGLIYQALDQCADFWACHARKEDRSLMNITFRAKAAGGGEGGGETLDDKFMAEAKANGMDGLKGHRSTGGMRASTYNAFPRAGCEALAQLIRDFAKRNG